MEINIYNNPDFPLEIKNDHIINFDYGIPGFEDLKKFTIVDIEDYNPFLLLHSVENHNIAMIVLNAGQLDIEADLKIPEEKLKELRNDDGEVGVFLILKVIDDEKNLTANTKAPIVINFQNRKGRQIILDNENLSMDYPITVS
ncbi:MAG: flagellar assembly protein FliW [Candidatus Marinimicrobia bacterium]|nr:flagellar assembly protein FliW [Candidatus Neomarinimicrobiota bacterium]|tara:strand:+ start:2283 stop:2711 length:429 start_codon:yes stop_codon:yes gene_type:complete